MQYTQHVCQQQYGIILYPGQFSPVVINCGTNTAKRCNVKWSVRVAFLERYLCTSKVPKVPRSLGSST